MHWISASRLFLSWRRSVVLFICKKNSPFHLGADDDDIQEGKLSTIIKIIIIRECATLWIKNEVSPPFLSPSFLPSFLPSSTWSSSSLSHIFSGQQQQQVIDPEEFHWTRNEETISLFPTQQQQLQLMNAKAKKCLPFRRLPLLILSFLSNLMRLLLLLFFIAAWTINIRRDDVIFVIGLPCYWCWSLNSRRAVWKHIECRVCDVLPMRWKYDVARRGDATSHTCRRLCVYMYTRYFRLHRLPLLDLLNVAPLVAICTNGQLLLLLLLTETLYAPSRNCAVHVGDDQLDDARNKGSTNDE